jgi:uracil-DNA glycosylase
MENIISDVHTDWRDVLANIYLKHKTHIDIIVEKYEDNNILPKQQYIFRTFDYFDKNALKVVILGQDCYHSLSKNSLPLACGLSFSVDEGCKTIPPSLRVIFDELHYEFGVRRTRTDLSDWSMQGVLMLNCALTVKQGKPNSHAKVWKPFTNDLIKYIAEHCKHVVYIFWGEFAKGYTKYINHTQNYVLECRHPSPLAQSKGPLQTFYRFLMKPIEIL